MLPMTKNFHGKKIESSINTLGRKYSNIYRALVRGNIHYKHKFLVASATCVIYQQVLNISRGGGGRRGEEGKKSYYDILQLTPKATQAQVKDAYYNLSKTYHPDQYKGTEDASVKFREITEAYQVIGNFQKRKMYDKGFLNVSTAATPAEAENYANKFHESRRKRSQVPTATGRTPVYDFDEWSKLHYASNRERREGAKMRFEEIQRTEVRDVEQKKADSIIFIILLGVIFYLISLSRGPNIDVPKQKDK
ncbi:dnaJ homolog subfamily C member 30, mitochondrial-like [Homarus americanus]|uniref:dnaJ homolog subfamily C member 30, mitochondrial-like n=1 Tax=Homarus americanus TaxID=6706 RepID=UPI001C481EA8|nr:dnaJ homolog subfamily C member 30, mitochondrial-like [Homarus americanus]